MAISMQHGRFEVQFHKGGPAKLVRHSTSKPWHLRDALDRPHWAIPPLTWTASSAVLLLLGSPVPGAGTKKPRRGRRGGVEVGVQARRETKKAPGADAMRAGRRGFRNGTSAKSGSRSRHPRWSGSDMAQRSSPERTTTHPH